MSFDESLGIKRPIQTPITDLLFETSLDIDNNSPTKLSISEDPILTSLAPCERGEAAKITLELYEVAREYIAPVIASFADYLLHEAVDRQIIFSGRDGIGSIGAASILKSKFEYPNKEPSQLVFAYLNRRVVYGTATDILATHLKQSGVKDLGASALLADIGMYGSVLPTVREVMPQIEPHYLVSKNDAIKGYASTPENTLTTFSSISGNPAVHFMEDTFSGPISSPTCLIEVNGYLMPDTFRPDYPPIEAIKRKYALVAIADYTRTLVEPPEQPATEAINNWNDFLADQFNYAHLMVPHQG